MTAVAFRSSFQYQALPMRVLFEVGAVAKVGEELDHLGLDRALILCTPEQRNLAELVAGHLGDRSAGIFDQARMHVPVETADQARDQARDLGADSCVVIGGGSSIGLGKAIALEHGLPIIAIPTTYAGSEMTPIWGLTRDGRKQTGRDPVVLPQSVIYDPSLTRTLPSEISAASGLNAVAHAVEALYAPDTSPIISLMAEEGVRAFTGSLPEVVADGDNLGARSRALFGAWLCGACLGSTTMSLHHKLCHVLGGSLDLPHAQTHAIVLPYALAYNETHAPDARAALQRALATDDDPSLALWDLEQQLSIPHSLAELGVRAEQLPTVIEEVLSNPYSNPAPVTEAGLEHLLTQALQGERPTHP
ncbi:maleylacetate reductase [Rhodococcus gannanensis]|uniref:Maleylacetate reductase n=1 Tax=Rhodococcus gannanensis TaxID=1960308 RepID=A0ABW4P2K7_9NOCA